MVIIFQLPKDFSIFKSKGLFATSSSYKSMLKSLTLIGNKFPIFQDQKGNNKHFFENAALKFLRDCITNWKIKSINSRVECVLKEQMIFNKWTDESFSDWISGS